MDPPTGGQRLVTTKIVIGLRLVKQRTTRSAQLSAHDPQLYGSLCGGDDGDSNAEASGVWGPAQGW